MSFTSDDVNLLLFRYLQESGERRERETVGFTSGPGRPSQPGIPSDALLGPRGQPRARQVAREGKKKEEEKRNKKSKKRAHRFNLFFDSGFTHTAFAFKAEAKLSDEALNEEKPRRGVLINYIQKGLVYTEIETHIRADGSEVSCRVPFSITQDHVCKEERTTSLVAGSSAGVNPTASDGVYQLLDTEVSKLVSHQGEVFACQWNPKMPNILATGASDATAVLWSLPRGPSGMAAGKSASDSKKVLQHAPPQSQSRDVTTLEWSPSGQQLATGSYDGTARVWNLTGEAAFTLTGHAGPIFSLRWTKDGRYLLSGGVDKSARIWDVNSGMQVKRFNVHEAPTLDVAWRDNTSFATCSSDKTVTYCQWDRAEPVHRWTEHSDEVNAVVWDQTGRLLASCSDDKTIKIWSPDDSNSVQTLHGHEREIYTVRWQPVTGNQRDSPKGRILSASFDGTARVWDVETGQIVRKLPRHKQPVYAIEFSPDGTYCVVGSFDRTIEVFHIETGKCIQSFTGPAGVFDVDWCSTPQGDKIAVATAKGAVSVFDVRKVDISTL